MTVTTATTAPGPPFSRNRLLQVLAGLYGVVWIWLAVAPKDRGDWLLENILAIATIAVLIWTYRRFRLSDLSYLLITIFMILHAVGAHYTYAEVPLGFWVKDWLGLSRNHFDRLVHFSFGLLLAYPFREILLRVGKIKGAWNVVLTIAVVMAFSDSFEVIESWVAAIVSPELGAAYLGTQGDEFDAQKDSTAATLGAILAMLATTYMPRSVLKSATR